MLALLTFVAGMVAPPPPIIRGPSQTPPVTLTFDVVIRHAEKLLWQGKLAMASNGSANLTQRREQTLSCPTADGRPNRIARFSTGFSLSLIPGYEERDRGAVRVSAKVDGPSGNGLLQEMCDNDSARGVAAQASFMPEPGKPFTVAGDAGFSVTLTLH